MLIPTPLRRLGLPVFLVALLPILLLPAGCATNPVTGELDFVTMTEEQEIAMGERYHPQILEQYGEYEDPQLQQYITRLGRKLAANSHRPELIYRFTVLDSPEVNAFALPGGYVYITRGILAYLNSEAEVGGVLGHEIGHVTARHGVQRQSAATAAQIFSTVVAIETGSRTYTDLSRLLGGALISGYGRGQELQADRLGAEYLANLGYNPKEMLGVVGVLKDQEEFAKARAEAEGETHQSYHGVFATHPENDKRLQEVINKVLKTGGTADRPAGHDQYLRRIEGMIYGQSPKHGIIRGGRFLHPELGIAFDIPQHWPTKNLADRFLMKSPDNHALIQLTTDALHKRETPKEYLYRVLDDPDARGEQSLTIHGLPAYSLITDAPAQSEYATARYTAILHDDRAYLLAGAVDRETDIGRYDKQFLDTARSFHPITAEERKRAKPYRITLYRTQAGDTYAKLAERIPLPHYREERLRLLNGDYPDKPLKPGRLIKLIE